MKNPLNYQSTEYDCGTTTLVNAIRFLYEREEIAPDLIKWIGTYMNDTFDEHGCHGKHGTSGPCVCFMAQWLGGYGKGNGFPIGAEFLCGSSVSIRPEGRIMECLREGGAVMLLCWSGRIRHYVLLTSIESEDTIGLFDPYWDPDEAYTMEQHRCVQVFDRPFSVNRIVQLEQLNDTGDTDYAMGEPVKREALLIYRTDRAEKAQ